MTAARDFSGDYAPGGVTSRAKWRQLGRKGGLASGVKRRQLSCDKYTAPRARSTDTALALAYNHRQLTRSKFDARYAEVFERPEWPAAVAAWERGRDTLWEHYLACWRLYRARGQHAGTTNGQRGAALSSRGRPRCRRTVQRLNRKLEQLGAAVLSWDKRGGKKPGNKDRLVLEIRTPDSQHVTPPPGARTLPTGVVLAVPPREDLKGSLRVPPPTAADDEPPDKPAEQPGTEKEELEAAIRFQQLKLDCGWGSGRIRAEQQALRVQLRRLREAHD